MWRRVLGVAAAAAVAVALWLAVLFDFPSFHGGSLHLPALGPSSPRPSPGALATPGSLPPGSNPQARAGLPGSGTRLTGAGNGAADVEDEPPDVEDEPAASSGGSPTGPVPAPAPAPAPGSVAQNLLPSAPPLPKPSLPAVPLPRPSVP